METENQPSSIQLGKLFTELGLETNFATNTKWLCNIPLQTLFPDLKGGLALNLSSWRIPEVTIGSTDAPSYFSKHVTIPSKILTPETQEITFEYILSSNYHQYILLYRWVQRIIVEMQKNTNIQMIGDLTKFRLPVSVILLSEFKTPVLMATYQNAWIQRFGELGLDYKSPDDDHVIHSFTLKFTHVDFTILADVHGVDGRVSLGQENTIIGYSKE